MKLLEYVPGIESDILLARWWETLAESGDLGEVFSVEFAALGAFMEGMKNTTLLYDYDDKGIWFAIWADRIMSGAFFGFWVREDRRPSINGNLAESLSRVHEGLDRFFGVYPVLFQVTRNPHIVELAMRIGAKILGRVPYIFDGEDAMITFLTKEDFAAYKENANVQGRIEN